MSADDEWPDTAEGDQAGLAGYDDQQATIEDAADVELDEEEYDDVREREADREDVVEDVFVATGHKTPILHHDEDCPNLATASNVQKKPRNVYPPDTPECKRCRPGSDLDEKNGRKGGNAAAEKREENAPETCPNGDERCNGEDDLRDGVLPCFECFRQAPEDLLDEFREHQERRRKAFATAEGVDL